MKRCAYLTMENSDDWAIDMDLAFPCLENLGWEITSVPWRTAAYDWGLFDAVYVGTPWDYPAAPVEFMNLLGSIQASGAILINDLSLIRWNLAKSYLRDLEKQGAGVVPGLWHDDFSMDSVTGAFEHFGVDNIIVKPVVSTNATDTFLLKRDISIEMQEHLASTFRDRAHVIQPFMVNITGDGEFSLIYFDRIFSHAIQKVPKKNDFRVQEEFGAEVRAIDPPAVLVDAGDKILNLVEPKPVYARVDLVRGSGDRFLLMELELIEPSMYLRTNKDAPRRFAEAFDRRFRTLSGQ